MAGVRAGSGHLVMDTCRRCGDAHDLFACPYVKAIDLDGDKITRVEFLLPIDFPPKRPDAAPEENYPRLGANLDGARD
jgi:hypothetical protein